MATSQSTVTYKDIPEFPGYRVGDDGSVWSRWKQVPKKGAGNKGKWVSVQTDQWRKLKAMLDDAGRPRVSPSLNGNQKPLRVCRLVLLAFVGPCPDGMEACHRDGNPANNFLDNLRWDTPLGNAADRKRHGREARGEKIGTARLSEAAVIDIRSNCVPGSRTRGFAAFAKKYDVGESTARRAWSGQAWAWLQKRGDL